MILSYAYSSFKTAPTLSRTDGRGRGAFSALTALSSAAAGGGGGLLLPSVVSEGTLGLLPGWAGAAPCRGVRIRGHECLPRMARLGLPPPLSDVLRLQLQKPPGLGSEQRPSSRPHRRGGRSACPSRCVSYQRPRSHRLCHWPLRRTRRTESASCNGEARA